MTNQYGANNGELTSVTYGNGKTVSYEYDKNGNVTAVLHDGSKVAEYHYDSAGNLYSMTDCLTGETACYYYDSNGNLTAQDGAVSIRYGINPETGNSYEAYTADGFTVRTESENGISGGNTTGLLLNGQEAASYRYNSLGSLEKKILSLAGNYTTTYTYRAGSSGSQLETVSNGTSTLRYTYDALGNITSITEGNTLLHTYTYDSLNQLVRDDDAGQGITFVYEYDGGGNIVLIRRYGYTTGDLSEASVGYRNIVYSYQNSNWKDLLTSWSGQTITYDAAGNALNYRNGMNFTWGGGNTLSSLTASDTTAAYTYNAEGIRTSKTVNGVKTTYILKGTDIVTLKQGTNRMDFYYDENGSLFGLRYNGVNYYYIKNGQNDIIGIVDTKFSTSKQ